MTHPLMEYTTPHGNEGGAAKYHGAIAQGYDQKREESPKWQIEQKVIEGWLADLPMGDWVLDCPAGTGRFIPVLPEARSDLCRGRPFARHAQAGGMQGHQSAKRAVARC